MSSLRSRKSVLSLAALGTILVAVLAYGVWWYELTARMRDGLVKWAADRQAAGWQVTLGEITLGGLPLHARLGIAAPHIVDRAGNGWSAAPVSLEIPLFAPTRARLLAKGPQQVTLAGLPPFAFTVGQAWTDILLTAGLADDIAVTIEDLTAEDVTISRLSGRFVQLAHGKVNESTAQWSLAVELEQLSLPKASGLPFGNQLPRASLQLHLMGSLGDGAPAEALGRWRAEGGTLEIDKLAFDWPPLSLEGSGTAALDAQMQPMLSSTCTIGGLPPALDQLADKGMLRRQDVAIAKLVLGALAKKGADGRSVVTVPLAIQNRQLSIGPMPLLTLPAISW